MLDKDNLEEIDISLDQRKVFVIADEKKELVASLKTEPKYNKSLVGCLAVFLEKSGFKVTLELNS